MVLLCVVIALQFRGILNRSIKIKHCSTTAYAEKFKSMIVVEYLALGLVISSSSFYITKNGHLRKYPYVSAHYRGGETLKKLSLPHSLSASKVESIVRECKEELLK